MTNSSASNSRATAGSGQWSRATSDGRVLWLAFDRRTALNEARWVRKNTGLDVVVVCSVREAIGECRKGPLLGCVIEFELAEQDGVHALADLRKAGVRAPAVLVSAAEELALGALVRSGFCEAVPVLSRAQRHSLLREWFEQLQTCCLVAV